ncbi:MAG: fatty acid metabolism transcriptional regulator FadR [Proteobacteria bacterium]|nr:fatty acid metabolism transcriptional regulator FadR [Pseudomonadota bacterium]
MQLERPLHPSRYTEYKLVTSILDGTYPQGSALPGERALSEQIGVTRPTLRETLQRLASEGWITIQHGKPTVVNDYWKEGGLSLLGTMAKYGDFLREDIIIHLLEFRIILVPFFARLAAVHAPKIISEYLDHTQDIEDKAEAFADFDWELQVLMARYSRNPIYPLLLNDFGAIFKAMALRYFSVQKARDVSRLYYLELARALDKSAEDVEQVVRSVMEKSTDIWRERKTFQGG